MGLTYLDLKVTSVDNPKKSRVQRFLIDSGATYSILPSSVLKELDVKPIDTQKFILANGETIEKSVGEARFEFRGKTRTAAVVFGEDDIFLLGATTLENLGLILDPISRQLKPLPMTM